jgi:hypothetical protein
MNEVDYQIFQEQVKVTTRLGVGLLYRQEKVNKDVLLTVASTLEEVISNPLPATLNRTLTDLLQEVIKDDDRLILDALDLVQLEIRRRGGLSFIDGADGLILSERSKGLILAVTAGMRDATR